MTRTRELPDRTVLKPSEVASLLNVSPQTVYFWHRMGVIEGVKIGGTLRILTSSLERVLRWPGHSPVVSRGSRGLS